MNAAPCCRLPCSTQKRKQKKKNKKKTQLAVEFVGDSLVGSGKGCVLLQAHCYSTPEKTEEKRQQAVELVVDSWWWKW